MAEGRMEYDGELAELADLLRVGAQTARVIASARRRDEAVILRLAAQADAMAAEIDGIVNPIGTHIICKPRKSKPA